MHGQRHSSLVGRLLTACACCAMATPAFADIVVFKTGSAKEGIVVEESETSVRFETEDGVVGIPRAAIEGITYANDDENRELRRKWALAREAEERERALRQAERQREREQEEASGAPDRQAAELERREAERTQQVQDRRRITRHQQEYLEARKKEAEAAKEQQAQAEADAKRRAAENTPYLRPGSRYQGKLVETPTPESQPAPQASESKPEAEEAATPQKEDSIGVQPLSIEEVLAAPNDQGGTTVTASIVNFGTVGYSRVQMDVELVENPRTADEHIVQRRTHRFAQIPAESIVRLSSTFAATPQIPYEARIVNLEATPAQ